MKGGGKYNKKDVYIYEKRELKTFKYIYIHYIGETVDLTQHDINVSASLLKVFFKELPNPLISLQLCSDVGKFSGNDQGFSYLNKKTNTCVT